MPRLNQHGQPIGDVVAFTTAQPVRPVTLEGRLVRLRPLVPDDAAELAAVLGVHDELWTYQSTEAPRTAEDARAVIEVDAAADDTQPFAVVDPAGGALLGRVHLMRAQPAVGSVEVGAIVWSPALQRTAAATEAQLLLADHVFDTLGYRRYEWKCDSLNAPSRRAALRLGFTEEGTWRQALVTKGRTRDTTWFGMTDADWPGVRDALRVWLDPSNHDGRGRQRRSLAAIREDRR
ncbi:MAG: GNAT family N-acetyltransferase [Micrococcales bacterium]|nr:GNAT family N-acetyltransferase [Micrococcales bacterium]